MKYPDQRPSFLLFAICIAVASLCGWSDSAEAYEQYSQNRDDTNCRMCHGDFRADGYVSFADGVSWSTSLHNGHRDTMLDFDCDVCHGSGSNFPVRLASSSGGQGLDPISCAGCHGRAEDHTPSNPGYPDYGYGAGLRQHHHNAGVIICADCHSDVLAADYIPVGEDVLPPYYPDPGPDPFHPNMPTSACNGDESEAFFGSTGLDNDGDQLYDGDDPDCENTAVPMAENQSGLFLQQSPNPLNSGTAIHYILPKPGWASLRVYTAAGRVVCTLADGYHEGSKVYSVRWEGRDENGHSLGSGIYFYRLDTTEGSQVRAVVLVQ